MLAYAFFSLVTRYLAPYDRAEVTLFYSLLAGTILAAPFAWAQWVPPDGLVGWTLMLSTGIYAGLGHYLFIIAHRYAPASTLMPFIYITLITHTTAGYVVFGQLPDAWTWLAPAWSSCPASTYCIASASRCAPPRFPSPWTPPSSAEFRPLRAGGDPRNYPAAIAWCRGCPPPRA